MSAGSTLPVLYRSHTHTLLQLSVTIEHTLLAAAPRQTTARTALFDRAHPLLLVHNYSRLSFATTFLVTNRDYDPPRSKQQLHIIKGHHMANRTLDRHDHLCSACFRHPSCWTKPRPWPSSCSRHQAPRPSRSRCLHRRSLHLVRRFLRLLVGCELSCWLLLWVCCLRIRFCKQI